MIKIGRDGAAVDVVAAAAADDVDDDDGDADLQERRCTHVETANHCPSHNKCSAWDRLVVISLTDMYACIKCNLPRLRM